MIGRSSPVTGAEIRICRLTIRPGVDSTNGLMEITGVGSLTGIFSALPINAWSFTTLRLVPLPAPVVELVDMSSMIS